MRDCNLDHRQSRCSATNCHLRYLGRRVSVALWRSGLFSQPAGEEVCIRLYNGVSILTQVTNSFPTHFYFFFLSFYSWVVWLPVWCDKPPFLMVLSSEKLILNLVLSYNNPFILLLVNWPEEIKITLMCKNNTKLWTPCRGLGSIHLYL